MQSHYNMIIASGRAYDVRRKSVITCTTENNSNDQRTVPGTAISLNLHLVVLKNSQYITLSDADQH